MELPHLGKHCDLLDCRQLDFLPFLCDCCKKTFCLEHHKYASHNCPVKKEQPKPVVVSVVKCPVCELNLSLLNNENPDQKIDQHMNSGNCTPLTKCAVARCRKNNSKTFFVRCRSCAKQYCWSHRFEADHKCASVRTVATKTRPEPVIKNIPSLISARAS